MSHIKYWSTKLSLTLLWSKKSYHNVTMGPAQLSINYKPWSIYKIIKVVPLTILIVLFEMLWQPWDNALSSAQQAWHHTTPQLIIRTFSWAAISLDKTSQPNWDHNIPMNLSVRKYYHIEFIRRAVNSKKLRICRNFPQTTNPPTSKSCDHSKGISVKKICCFYETVDFGHDWQ